MSAREPLRFVGAGLAIIDKAMNKNVRLKRCPDNGFTMQTSHRFFPV